MQPIAKLHFGSAYDNTTLFIQIQNHHTTHHSPLYTYILGIRNVWTVRYNTDLINTLSSYLLVHSVWGGP